MRFVPEYPPIGTDPVLSEWAYRELTRLFASVEVAMAALTNKSWYVDIAQGNVSGNSLVHKFGRNDAVPNGSWAPVTLLGTVSHLSAATTVRVKAGDANDTAAGTGAREITVQGIDNSGDEVSEAIATAGTSASSSTTTQFYRVHRAWVSSAGSGATNAAAVVIENTAGTTDLISIAASEGQSQYASWSVPSGKTAYLLSIHCWVDSGKSANLKVMTRANNTDVTAPVSSKRLKLFFDGVKGSMEYVPIAPELSLSENTDIWVEAYGDGAVSQVSANFELLVVDN